MTIIGKFTYYGLELQVTYKNKESMFQIEVHSLTELPEVERLDGDPYFIGSIGGYKGTTELYYKGNYFYANIFYETMAEFNTRTALKKEVIDEYLHQTKFSYNDSEEEFSCITQHNVIINLEFKNSYCGFFPQKITTAGSFTMKALKTTFSPLNEVSRKVEEASKKFKALSAKTFEQLRSTMDLTWYISTEGKLNKDYRVIKNLEELKSLITRVVPQIKVWAVDTETDTLDFFEGVTDANIVGMSISWKVDTAIYLPFAHTEFENLPLKETLEFLKPYLETVPAVLFNALFDARVFLHYGIYLKIYSDVQMIGATLNPKIQKGFNSLKGMTHRFYQHLTIEMKNIFGSSADATLFKYLTEQVAKVYACADADYTLTLFLDLIGFINSNYRHLAINDTPALRELRPDNKLYNSYNTSMKVIRRLYKQEYRGLGIKTQMALDLNEANNKDLEMIKVLIFKYTGQMVSLLLYKKKLEEEFIFDEESMAKKLQEYQLTSEYQNANIEFNISSSIDTAQVLYKILKYPIQAVSESFLKSMGGMIPKGYDIPVKYLSVQAESLLNIARYEAVEPSNWLKEDIYSSALELNLEGTKKEDYLLLKANDFNNKAFPLVSLLLIYRILEKRHTTDFKALVKDSKGGRFYSGNKMANIETLRISSRIQTLGGYMKQMITSIDENEYFFFSYDYRQIELRVINGQANKKYQGSANVKKKVEALNNGETDFHVESIASILQKDPDDVTKSERSDGKAVNFGIVYGKGPTAITADSMHISKRDVTDELRKKGIKLLQDWSTDNYEVARVLASNEEFTIKNLYIMDEAGSRRIFDPPADEEERAAIGRRGKNFPVQSYAGYLFKQGFIRMIDEIDRRGLSNDINIPALVHDEGDGYARKGKVHPYELINIIQENAVLTIPYHPTYYVAVNIVPDWYMAKEGTYELPVEFMEEKAKLWREGHYKDEIITDIYLYVWRDLYEYYERRIFKYIKSVMPNIEEVDVFPLDKFSKVKGYYIKSVVEKKLNRDVTSCIDKDYGDSVYDKLYTVAKRFLPKIRRETTEEHLTNEFQPIDVKLLDEDRNKLINLEDEDSLLSLLEEDFMLESFVILSNVKLSEKVKAAPLYEDRIPPKGVKPTIWNTTSWGDSIKLAENTEIEQSYHGMINDEILCLDLRNSPDLKRLLSYIKEKNCNPKNLGAVHLYWQVGPLPEDSGLYIRNFDCGMLDKLCNQKDR